MRIVLGCSDGFVEEYDIRNESSPIIAKKIHDGFVSRAYVIQSNFIISSSFDGVVSKWDINNGSNDLQQQRVLSDHGCLTSCCVDERHQIVVAGGSSGILYISSFN